MSGLIVAATEISEVRPRPNADRLELEAARMSRCYTLSSAFHIIVSAIVNLVFRIKRVRRQRKQHNFAGRRICCWEHATWGNSVSITRWGDKRSRGEGEATGWLPFKVKKGDWLRYKTKGGRIAERRITSVRYPGNPPDMFFATLEDKFYRIG